MWANTSALPPIRDLYTSAVVSFELHPYSSNLSSKTITELARHTHHRKHAAKCVSDPVHGTDRATAAGETEIFVMMKTFANIRRLCASELVWWSPHHLESYEIQNGGRTYRSAIPKWVIDNIAVRMTQVPQFLIIFHISLPHMRIGWDLNGLDGGHPNRCRRHRRQFIHFDHIALWYLSSSNHRFTFNCDKFMVSPYDSSSSPPPIGLIQVSQWHDLPWCSHTTIFYAIGAPCQQLQSQKWEHIRFRVPDKVGNHCRVWPVSSHRPTFWVEHFTNYVCM